MARNFQHWSNICSILMQTSFAIAVSFSMIFFVFLMASIAWASYQQSYVDVKELKRLRALPAELAKRDASLANAEARVKELKADLAKPKQKDQAASSPEIKYRFATIKVPKEPNWFSEQWALYSFLKRCFRNSSERQRYWQVFEKQIKETTTKANEAAATAQEQSLRLSTAEAQINELEAQVTKNNEAAEAADARLNGLKAVVTGVLDDSMVKMLHDITRLSGNARELEANHTETQAQIKELKSSHGGTGVQINQLKAQFMEMKSAQFKQTAERLAPQPSGMEAEDHLSSPEEPTRIGGQEDDASQLENVTDKRRDQSCVTVAEEVKRLEVAEKKVEEERLKAERWQSQSDFAVAIREEYDVVQVPVPNEG
ncbi:hypothetical protein VE02_10001 [Pseudogymnoascus sp. 03VT05]|nr:hypothetical protein VE02_10001 [Pseudogymnoascus sp. 03VT05]